MKPNIVQGIMVEGVPVNGRNVTVMLECY